MRFNKLKLLLAITVLGTTVFNAFPVNAFVNKDVAMTELEKVVVEKMEGMTIEQKVGQMIMPDFRIWNGAHHTELSSEVANVIDKYDLGGVILFAENVKETEQTTKLVHDLQQVVKNDESNDIPLMITIDQEGGIVTRLGTGTNLPGNMAIGATRSPELAYQAGKIIGAELESLGINVNFAPVLDVNNNPANPVIGVRSISSDPQLVGELGSQMIQGIQDQGVAATAKHFPGHGDTATDSHYGLPIVDKSFDELMKTEFVPFKKSIDEGIDMIMTAHIGMPQLEDETFEGGTPIPATLSDDVITGTLRGKLGYDGVVVTDALNMKAISDNFTEAEAVIKTINAGVDIALMPTVLRTSEDVAKLDTIINEVVQAVKDGVILEEEINDSVERILKLKLQRGIWNPAGAEDEKLEDKIENALSVVGNPDHKAIEKEISEKAVTLVKNENHMLPFKPKSGETVLVVAPSKDQTDSMQKAINNLTKEGTIKTVKVITANYNSSTGHNNEELMKKVDEADYVIVGSNVNNGAGLKQSSFGHYIPEEILSYANETGKKSVLLSLRNPYDVAVHPEAKAQVVIYGFKGDPNGPDSEAGNLKAAGPNLPAGIGAIFGDFKVSGKLPVEIPVFDDGTVTDDVHLPFGFGFKNWNR